MRHAAAVAILGLALAGCAPRIPLLVVTPGGGAEPATASEIMSEGAVTPRHGTGAISVTAKPAGRLTEACTFDVALDDLPVAGLRPGERVTLFAEPGWRTITLSVRDEGSCIPQSRQVAMRVVEHTTQRILVDSDARAALKVEVDRFGRSLPP